MLLQDFKIGHSAICNQSKSKDVIKPAQIKIIIVGAQEIRLEWGWGLTAGEKRDISPHNCQLKALSLTDSL